MHLAGDDLALLVALARHHQHIALAQHLAGGADGLAAIADLPGAGGGGQDGGADRGGLLAPGIVVGDDGDVGQLGRRLAHQGPLAAVAVAAGAEDHDQLAAGVRAQSFQHCLQAVGGVGVVDIGLAPMQPRTHALQSSRRAFDVLQRAQHGLDAFAGADAEAGGHQGVGGLEGARQRQADLEAAAVGLELQALAVGDQLAVQLPQPLPGLAHRIDRLAVGHGGGGEGAVSVGVGIQHGRPAARQQGLEQAQLGGPVGAHGAVVVEVVLGQVGEARGDDVHAVQPPLIDAVRGGFQRQVGDALGGQLGEETRDVGGVGGGEAGRGQLIVAGAHAERTHAGALAAQAFEDLATEHGHRGLAVGARDGHAGPGLGAVEGPRRQGIGAAQVGGMHHRGGEIGHVIGGKDRGGSGLERGGDEAAAVGPGSGQGHEQEAALDLAAVGGDA